MHWGEETWLQNKNKISQHLLPVAKGVNYNATDWVNPYC